MYAPTITPSIEVTIGRETRLYHAFITTAPARFDAPATVTLHTGPLSDVSGIAANPISLSNRAEAWRPWRSYAALHLWLNGEAE